MWSRIKNWFRSIGKKSNEAWDEIAPVVNKVFISLAHSVPKIAFQIIKEEVLKVGLSRLRDSRARSTAFDNIKASLKREGLSLRDSAINTIMEMYNYERKI